MSLIFILILIFAVLLLWIIAGAKGYLIAKFITVPIALYAILAVYYSLTGVLGWASIDTLPPKFELVYVSIQEPIPAFSDDGKIVLLIRGLDDEKRSWFQVYDPPDKEFRLYHLPYSKDMHKNLEEAIAMLKAGKRVMGKSGKGEPGDGDGEGKGDGKDGKGNIGGGDRISDHKFYILPPIKQKEKI